MISQAIQKLPQWNHFSTRWGLISPDLVLTCKWMQMLTQQPPDMLLADMRMYLGSVVSFETLEPGNKGCDGWACPFNILFLWILMFVFYFYIKKSIYLVVDVSSPTCCIYPPAIKHGSLEDLSYYKPPCCSGISQSGMVDDTCSPILLVTYRILSPSYPPH